MCCSEEDRKEARWCKMMVSGATLDQVRLTMDRWIIAGSGLEVVTELEQSALRRFLQTVSRTAECTASALLVIEVS